MIELLIQCRATGRIDKWPAISELHQIGEPGNMDWEKQLWVDARGNLLAFAILGRHFGNLYFYLQPQLHEDDELKRQIIAWAFAQRQKAQAEPPSVRCQIREDDSATIELLEAEGFVRQERYTLRLIRPLVEPIPQPELPPGFTIRHVRGEHEVEEYVAMHRAAFGTNYMTVEWRLAFMRNLAYIPELDLIVVSPEGIFAAFCVGGIDQEENSRNGSQEGWTDPIGTRPDFQRLGLARAVVLAGLQQLRNYGMDSALIGTGSWNVATQQLCQSAGFRLLYNVAWYTKEMS
jgi:ribosomal protein S18 acetylase RimI-like enzyme